jgi:hypothetical protein
MQDCLQLDYSSEIKRDFSKDREKLNQFPFKNSVSAERIGG